MLGLLCFPNFAEPLVTFFAFANLTHLRVKTFELLALRIGGHLDRALFRNERDLIVSVFVRRAVEHGTDPLAHRHVVIAPGRLEKNAIAALGGAFRESNE